MSEVTSNMNGEEIKCPACAEQILKAAKKCRHCGEILDSNFVSKTENHSAVNRKVGFILGIGIFFFPYLFSWLTLRKGHSVKSRLIALSWFAVVLLIISGPKKSNLSNDVKATSVPVEQAVNNQAAAAPVDDVGIWKLGQYVDKFGDPTKEGFIVNGQPIKGVFSNTATTNSDLNVVLLINSASDISIQLYEYASNNPVKTYGTTKYAVLVKGNGGNKLNLSATNYSDRLSLNSTSSKKLFNELKSGGTIAFSIHETENSVNTYNFVIDNADGFTNAFKKLSSKK